MAEEKRAHRAQPYGSKAAKGLDAILRRADTEHALSEHVAAGRPLDNSLFRSISKMPMRERAEIIMPYLMPVEGIPAPGVPCAFDQRNFLAAQMLRLSFPRIRGCEAIGAQKREKRFDDIVEKADRILGDFAEKLVDMGATEVSFRAGFSAVIQGSAEIRFDLEKVAGYLLRKRIVAQPDAGGKPAEQP